MQITTLDKLSKHNIDEEIKYIKESEEVSNQAENGDKKSGDNVKAVRKSIAKTIKIDSLIGQKSINSANSFR